MSGDDSLLRNTLSPVNRPSLLTWRYALILVGIWLMAGAGLSLIWPIQPRLTLGRNGELSIGGVSPDGGKLVTFTRRAELTTFSSSEGGQFIDYSDRISGPIQIWDLNTGRGMMVPIPGQKSKDEYVKCHFGGWLMRNDNALHIRVESDPCRQNWFLFSTTEREGKWHSRWILELSTGELRQLDTERHWNVTLSPTGRWCMILEENSWWPKSKARQTDRIVVYETATMKPRIEVEKSTDSKGQFGNFTGEFSNCFSPDDSFFTVADGTGGSTKVFDLETGKITLSIDRCLRGVTFAKRHNWIAGQAGINVDSEPAYGELEVWDISSGERLYQRRDEAIAFLAAPKFEFVNDDSWLICLHPNNSFEGGEEVHTRLNLEFSWCLDTDDIVVQSEPSATYDLTISRNGILPAVFAPLFSKFNDEKSMLELFEWTTGKRADTAEKNGYPIFLAQNCRTFIQEYQSESRINSYLWWLSSKGVPISALLRWAPIGQVCRWEIVDLQTKEKKGSVPGQYQITYPSRDESTLVTISSGAGGMIHVWDLPFRRSTTRPYLWAALVPGFNFSLRVIKRFWLDRFRYGARN